MYANPVSTVKLTGGDDGLIVTAVVVEVVNISPAAPVGP
jgi:hypothetical protein